MLNSQELENKIKTSMSNLDRTDPNIAITAHKSYYETINSYVENNAEIELIFNGTTPSGSPFVLELDGNVNKMLIETKPDPSLTSGSWVNTIISTLGFSTILPNIEGFQPNIILLSTAPTISTFNFVPNTKQDNIQVFSEYFIDYFKTLINANTPTTYNGNIIGVLSVNFIL